MKRNSLSPSKIYWTPPAGRIGWIFVDSVCSNISLVGTKNFVLSDFFHILKLRRHSMKCFQILKHHSRKNYERRFHVSLFSHSFTHLFFNPHHQTPHQNPALYLPAPRTLPRPRFNSRLDPFPPKCSATQESMKINKAKNQPKSIKNV